MRSGAAGGSPRVIPSTWAIPEITRPKTVYWPFRKWLSLKLMKNWLFAEFGFEGAVDEKAGWATPSAAYSDPEAAPEDWFAETPASMEAGATEPATDSWFEQPEPAAEAESASVQQDEYWMPDFASVGADASAGDAGPPAAEAAPQAAVEVPYEASASMASAFGAQRLTMRISAACATCTPVMVETQITPGSQSRTFFGLPCRTRNTMVEV